MQYMKPLSGYVCERALSMLLNVQFNCLYERTTSDKHFGKYIVTILCFSRSLSLEEKSHQETRLSAYKKSLIMMHITVFLA